jgi:hypothetical protein
VQTPCPLVAVQGIVPQRQTSAPAQLQVRGEPQPGVPGWMVTLHSVGVHWAAGVQHSSVPPMVSHCCPAAHSLHIVVGGGTAVLHESGSSSHLPAGTVLQVLRVQQVPGVPAGGGRPGAPVALLTHSWFGPVQGTLMSLLPHPFGRFVPHWPEYDAAVLGVQHVPGVPAGGGPPAAWMHVPVAQGQLIVAPQLAGRVVPHIPA